MNPDASARFIRDAIIAQVYVHGSNETISDSAGGETPQGWLFDFRRVIMQGSMISAIGEVFTHTFKHMPSYQVCGLEVAAIPLVTGITQYRFSHGETSANGFFIRKSRKKEGLLRMIEGTIQKDAPIILVDDIMNHGRTFMRQIQVLEGLGYTVSAVWTILRYRDESFYTFLKERNITIHSLLTLDDLTKDLKVKNLLANPEAPRMMQEYAPLWKFTSDKPNYFWVVPKSGPVLDASRVYFGADNGHFWSLNQNDGSVAWSYKVGLGPKGKSIFSTPAINDSTIYFGAYDGNLYALNTETGARKWVFFDADWIGSSPAIAPDIGLIFIGLEFGLFRKRGGIAAVSLKTGEKVWWDATMRNYTHASPLYLHKTKEVVIGSNDGVLRLYDAATGTKKWSSKTGDPNPKELSSGFSEFDIKSAPAYSEKNDVLVVANMHGDVFGIARTSGEHMWHATLEFGVFGSPVVADNCAYIASLDKHLYCISTIDGSVRWKTHLGARLFSTPVCINDTLCIGSNDGRIYTIQRSNGSILAYTTLTERITNAVAYNKDSETLFACTFANEMYALKKKVS